MPLISGFVLTTKIGGKYYYSALFTKMKNGKMRIILTRHIMEAFIIRNKEDALKMLQQSTTEHIFKVESYTILN